VAVDTNFPAFSDAHVEDVHDPHHVLESSTGHVLPTLIETVNSVLVEVLWDVTETNIRNDSVTTVWVLSRFLQIQNCDDFLLLELLVNVEFLD
jgi:hypothetical protein